jgi:hypothetical protein
MSADAVFKKCCMVKNEAPRHCGVAKIARAVVEKHSVFAFGTRQGSVVGPGFFFLRCYLNSGRRSQRHARCRRIGIHGRSHGYGQHWRAPGGGYCDGITHVRGEATFAGR